MEIYQKEILDYLSRPPVKCIYISNKPMMNKLLLTLGFLFYTAIAFSQNTGWAKSIGGSVNSDWAIDIRTDDSGNVFTTGVFQGIVDFDPGSATYNLTSAGAQDFYILKLNAAGDFVWAKRIGGTQNDVAYSLALDDSANLYITGYFFGIVDFDPGLGSFNVTSNGNNDAYILKVNSDGNFIWVKTFGSSSGPELGRCIRLDSQKSIYVTGTFYTTVDFDPGSGTYNLTSVSGADAYILKLDSNANFVWVKQIGGTDYDFMTAVAIDDSSNIYISGYFGGRIDLNTDSTSTDTFWVNSKGGYDICVLKLSNNGNFFWAKSVGGTLNDYASNSKISNSGDFYITGYFSATIDFNPGPVIDTISSAGAYDIFIMKLNTAGNYFWTKRMGSTLDDAGSFLATDTSNNIYLTGYFQNTVDFNPGTAVYNLSSLGNTDLFLVKLNSNGVFIRAQRFGASSVDNGNCLYVNDSGNIYLGGSFSATVDFDPGTPVLNLSSLGFQDAFVLKLNSAGYLPVTLLNFQASKYKNTVDLNWNTVSEFNNSYFVVERSVDHSKWIMVGKVNGSGTCSSMSSYKFTDESINLADQQNNTLFYRLKQVDYDGHFEYSKIVSVGFEKTENAIRVFPNPFKDEIYFSDLIIQEDYHLEFYDMTGRKILEKTISGAEPKIDLNGIAQPGVYFMKVGNNVYKLVKENL